MFESVIGMSMEKSGPSNKNGNPEKAKSLFGKDFLGEKAVHTLEKKFSERGINVTFNLPKEKFALNENQLKSAKEVAERKVFLRPRSMVVNGEEKPINILTLRALFIKDGVNPADNTINRTRYDNNLFGTGFVFSMDRWYDNEKFAEKELTPEYAVVTKEFVPNSTNATRDEQEAILKPGERRTEPIEDVWDFILQYAATGEKLFDATKWNATNATFLNDQIVIIVGGSDSMGLNIKPFDTLNKAPKIGMRAQLNNPPLI